MVNLPLVLLWVLFWLQKDEDRRRTDDQRSQSDQRKKEEQDRREREVRGVWALDVV